MTTVPARPKVTIYNSDKKSYLVASYYSPIETLSLAGTVVDV